MIDLSKRNFFSFANCKQIDLCLSLFVISLLIIGFFMLYSAAGGNLQPWSSTQILRFIVCLPIIFIIISINPIIFYQSAYLIYALGLALLIYANYSGFSALGAKRWVDLYFFNLQPSELMKISLIIGLARYFHNVHIYKVSNPLYLIIPIIMVTLPVLLILKQPDLGTSVILMMTSLIIFFVSGVQIKNFFFLAIGLLSAIPIIWSNLKNYQQQRILTFLNPEHDPLGSGYNIIQSKIAIGSGGFLGKGYLSGTQGQLNFLPESETDFIFTMFAEEFGFVGSVFMIMLFTLIFTRCYFISLQIKSQFFKLLTLGLSSFLFFHFIINIAMVMGLIPVVGAPLPLISYGGTMLIITLVSFAMILNLDINKDILITEN